MKATIFILFLCLIISGCSEPGAEKINTGQEFELELSEKAQLDSDGMHVVVYAGMDSDRKTYFMVYKLGGSYPFAYTVTYPVSMKRFKIEGFEFRISEIDPERVRMTLLHSEIH